MKNKAMTLIISICGLIILFEILTIYANVPGWITIAVSALGAVVMIVGALILTRGKDKK